MHRQFAGILGAAAFTISLVNSVVQGAGATAAVPHAVGMLIGFTLLGAVAGRIGLWMVEEGVSARLHEALAEKNEKSKPKGSS